MNLNENIKKFGLAKVAIDNWYQGELVNFKNNVISQSLQSQSINGQFNLEDRLWKAVNLQGQIFYLFKSIISGTNELIYMEDGKIDKGFWEYLDSNKKISITIFNNNIIYSIEEVADFSAKFKTNTDDYLELNIV